MSDPKTTPPDVFDEAGPISREAWDALSPKTTEDLALYDRCCAEGRAAYLDGRGVTECPYPAGSYERGAWKDGYYG